MTHGAMPLPAGIASIGSYVSFAGLIIFLFGMGYAFARKVRAASNPWGAGA